jgi:hypothetical protein
MHKLVTKQGPRPKPHCAAVSLPATIRPIQWFPKAKLMQSCPLHDIIRNMCNTCPHACAVLPFWLSETLRIDPHNTTYVQISHNRMAIRLEVLDWLPFTVVARSGAWTELGVPITLEERMSVCVYSVIVLYCLLVAVLWRADSPPRGPTDCT